MKISVVSDVHLEFMEGPEQAYWFDQITDTDSGNLVIAGDLMPIRSYFEVVNVMSLFCDRFQRVFYVPGNHEYYGQDFLETQDIFVTMESALRPRLHVLRNDMHSVVDGDHFLRFFGGTMWFPEDPRIPIYRRSLNDFSRIKRLEPSIYHENREFRSKLGSYKPGTIDVVVTHHLPSFRSVPEPYRTVPGNMFFVSDEERLIDAVRPRVWIHGHTHTPCDYTLGDTRIVCNPKGYPHEGLNGFNPQFQIEV